MSAIAEGAWREDSSLAHTSALGARSNGVVVESFEDVFRRVLPRALAVAQRILGNGTQAEDAAAEAFARAHASWKKVGTSSYRDAWILRVAANVAIDMGRSRRRSLAFGLRLVEPNEPQRTPEIDAGLSRVVLATALASLPRRQREIVILRYFEDFSEREVADALGISTGTVKKDAFRARQTLRHKLGRDAAI